MNFELCTAKRVSSMQRSSKETCNQYSCTQVWYDCRSSTLNMTRKAAELETASGLRRLTPGHLDHVLGTTQPTLNCLYKAGGRSMWEASLSGQLGRDGKYLCFTMDNGKQQRPNPCIALQRALDVLSVQTMIDPLEVTNAPADRRKPLLRSILPGCVYLCSMRLSVNFNFYLERSPLSMLIVTVVLLLRMSSFSLRYVLCMLMDILYGDLDFRAYPANLRRPAAEFVFIIYLSSLDLVATLHDRLGYCWLETATRCNKALFKHRWALDRFRLLDDYRFRDIMS
nr:hypothetical protein CFP56_56068 [Quercus suber]